MAQRMKATIFAKPNRIVPEEKPIPDVGPLDAPIGITTTTMRQSVDYWQTAQALGDEHRTATKHLRAPPARLAI